MDITVIAGILDDVERRKFLTLPVLELLTLYRLRYTNVLAPNP
jgi:hypothetical protein